MTDCSRESINPKPRGMRPRGFVVPRRGGEHGYAAWRERGPGWLAQAVLAERMGVRRVCDASGLSCVGVVMSWIRLRRVRNVPGSQCRVRNASDHNLSGLQIEETISPILLDTEGSLEIVEIFSSIFHGKRCHSRSGRG